MSISTTLVCLVGGIVIGILIFIIEDKVCCTQDCCSIDCQYSDTCKGYCCDGSTPHNCQSPCCNGEGK